MMELKLKNWLKKNTKNDANQIGLTHQTHDTSHETGITS
jgi:hypothetical protein